MEDQNKPNPNAGKPENKPQSGAGKPKADPKKKTANKEKESGGGRNGLIIVMIIIILALGGTVGYLWVELTSLEDKLSNKDTVIEKKDKELDDVGMKLDNKIAQLTQQSKELKELGIENDELDAQISSLKEDLGKWKSAAQSSARERDILKRKLDKALAEAELQRVEMEEEIDRYKMLSDSLSTEVETLSSERTEMSDSLITLDEKVKVASILKAENTQVSVLRSNGKEIKRDDYRINQVDKVKIVFELGDNAVAKKNEKTIILRIIDTEGSVLFDKEAGGGGSFETADGSTNFYTMKQTVKFKNENEEVSFLFNNESEYVEGTYEIEIYCDGHKIGSDKLIIDNSIF